MECLTLSHFIERYSPESAHSIWLMFWRVHICGSWREGCERVRASAQACSSGWRRHLSGTIDRAPSSDYKIKMKKSICLLANSKNGDIQGARLMRTLRSLTGDDSLGFFGYGG